MAKTVGIDLDTTNSVIAAVEGGQPTVIPNAERTVMITETSNLNRADVERMVADAQAHREQDARLRQFVEARNELESPAYQVERRICDLGDAVPESEKARTVRLAGGARQAVGEDAPLDRVRSLIGELQHVAQALSAQAAGGGPMEGGAAPLPSAGEDVVDADFTAS